MNTDKLETYGLASPLGLIEIEIGIGDGCICALRFADASSGQARIPAAPAALQLLLGDWFEGRSSGLERVSPELPGTAFQRLVWAALREIPRGERISYRELAQRVGRPRAVRAVASAVAANPVLLLVPCHRVIGADGRLRGYAGGVDRKRRLLEMEGATGRAGA